MWKLDTSSLTWTQLATTATSQAHSGQGEAAQGGKEGKGPAAAAASKGREWVACCDMCVPEEALKGDGQEDCLGSLHFASFHSDS